MKKDENGNPYMIGNINGNVKQRYAQISRSDNLFVEIGSVINVISNKDQNIQLTKKIRKISGNNQLGCTIPREWWDEFPLRDKVKIYPIRN